MPVLAQETYRTDHTPWSGYWWSYRKGGLSTGQGYYGKPAPLDKFELLTQGKYTGNIVNYYESRYYDPAAPYWFGLCANWAQAAVFEEYEILPSSENNIIFRVGDKKGLLTLAHTNNLQEIGDGSRPDVFHYWLLHYIRDNGQSFVADLDTSEEIWSYPIYEYQMETHRFGNRESVDVIIFYADDAVHPDYMGTQIRADRFTYDLYMDSSGAITGGEWTGDNVGRYPQKLTYPLMTQNVTPELDYSRVVEIAKSRDDYLETPEGVTTIGPGTYNLVLLNEDKYRFACKSGESVILSIEKLDGANPNISVLVEDEAGNAVMTAEVEKNKPLNTVIPVTAAPFFVRLSQDDNYADPNIYTMVVDYEKNFSQQIPYLPKSLLWSGFALTNPSTVPVDNVQMVTYAMDGSPIQTVKGPFQLAPGEKQLFFYDDLSQRVHEESGTEKIILMADEKVCLVNLLGKSMDSIASFVQNDARGQKLVIPETSSPFTPGQSMRGGVTNEAIAAGDFSLNLFSSTGNLMKSHSGNLNRGGTLEIRPGFYPFYNMPDDGWIEVSAAAGGMLSGFHYTSSANRMENLFALPVKTGQKVVPHVPPAGTWDTVLTVINTSASENQITLHPARAGADTSEDVAFQMAPFEKQAILLGGYFGKMAGDPLYRSIVIVNSSSDFVGYFTYQTKNGEANFPLLEASDFRQELILPHNPPNVNVWWVGVSVSNAGTQSMTVVAEPYDTTGNVIQEKIRSLAIDGGSYELFTVASLFGKATAKKISFVKFKASESSRNIGGIFLYGNVGNSLLTGSKM